MSDRKLELKDVAGYLPHGLATFCYDRKKEDAVYFPSLATIDLFFRDGRIWGGKAKPILRPPSDLYREITHNGKEIVPIVELAKMHCAELEWTLSEDETFAIAPNPNAPGRNVYFKLAPDCYFEVDTSHDIGLGKAYIPWDYMHDLKIDYRGLIDEGLAVATHDVKEVVYG
jgi:hypothetical protein